jgi:hypothetical protein
MHAISCAQTQPTQQPNQTKTSQAGASVTSKPNQTDRLDAKPAFAEPTQELDPWRGAIGVVLPPRGLGDLEYLG